VPYQSFSTNGQVSGKRNFMEKSRNKIVIRCALLANLHNLQIERVMKMDIIIRKMEMEDIKQVQRVAKISWNSTYEGIIPIEIQEIFLNSSYSEEMMKRRVENSFILVSEVNGRIVGFANFSPAKEGGEVELGVPIVSRNWNRNFPIKRWN
jgi:hypothetical protein